MNVWLLKHPISIYNEDVKKLAREFDLRIIDEAFADTIDDQYLEKFPPQVTIKGATYIEGTIEDKIEDPLEQKIEEIIPAKKVSKKKGIVKNDG